MFSIKMEKLNEYLKSEEILEFMNGKENNYGYSKSK